MEQIAQAILGGIPLLIFAFCGVVLLYRSVTEG